MSTIASRARDSKHATLWEPSRVWERFAVIREQAKRTADFCSETFSRITCADIERAFIYNVLAILLG